ncbi:MAG: hypothetical protein WC393_02155 [Candidatus Nanoarchaeia archaeon]|jgi:uncharacterized protein YdcH (DUF465 family)
MGEGSGLIDALNSSSNDDETRIKLVYLEETIELITKNIITMAAYFDEKFSSLYNQINSLDQNIHSLENRYALIETQVNSLETVLPKDNISNENPSVRSMAIGLLTDLYNPAKPANNLSMPPPPPKAPITQNNTELPTNDKPSHNDLMNELKKKFELLKGKTDEAD